MTTRTSDAGDQWLAALHHARATGRHRQIADTAEAMHWFSDLTGPNGSTSSSTPQPPPEPSAASAKN